MIKISFEAATVPELMGYITAYIASVSAPPEHAPPEPEVAPVKEMGEAAQEMVAEGNAFAAQAKKRGRPRKEPENKPIDVMHNELDDEDLEEEEVTPEQREAVDLEKLKQKTLDRLKDLFVAGKGTFVREMLKLHGHGAKVFPEVEAKYFPAIAEAIERELN